MAFTASTDRVCETLTTCTDAQWETKARTATSDRECAAHTTCTSTEWESVPASEHQDRVCKAHTTCTESEWQTKSHGSYHDRECEAHATCGEGQWEIKAAGALYNRECRDHTTCTETQWETKGAETHADRKCADHTTCGAAQWETKAAEAKADRACKEHSICDFSSEWMAQEAGTHNDRDCRPLTACDYSKEWRSTDKTQASDRVCTALTFCDFETQYESTQKTEISDRTCTALTLCAAGHYVTTPETYETDRECGLCPAGTYMATAGAPLACKPCPAGMISRAHRKMCVVQTCSHLFCKHELHTCEFGRVRRHRAFNQFKTLAEWPHVQEECDGRVWDSIRVYHDAVETNCRDGHKCGMGAVSGDMTKCECEPAPALKTPTVRTIVSPVTRGLYGASDMKIQALELTAQTKVCVNKDDISKFTVAYRAANAKPTHALAFKLEFDTRFFRVKSAKTSPNPGCGLQGAVDPANVLAYGDQAFLPYLCTSLSNNLIVPSKDDHILEVELEVVGGHEGVTKVAVVANPHIHGAGFKYEVAAPIQLRIGHCGPE